MVAGSMHRAIAIGIGILLSAPGLSMPHSVTVKAVTVDKDGQWMSKPYADISREQCATFRLPGSRAFASFKRSKEISFHEWNKMDVSPCYAEGKITTTNGKVYSWFMDDVGRAQIYLNKTKVIYLSGPYVSPS